MTLYFCLNVASFDELSLFNDKIGNTKQLYGQSLPIDECLSSITYFDLRPLPKYTYMFMGIKANTFHLMFFFGWPYMRYSCYVRLLRINVNENRIMSLFTVLNILIEPREIRLILFYRPWVFKHGPSDLFFIFGLFTTNKFKRDKPTGIWTHNLSNTSHPHNHSTRVFSSSEFYFYLLKKYSPCLVVFLKWAIPGLFFFIYVFSIQLTATNIQ